MATAWENLLAKSSLVSGIAWDHLISSFSSVPSTPDPVYVDTKFKIQKKAFTKDTYNKIKFSTSINKIGFSTKTITTKFTMKVTPIKFSTKTYKINFTVKTL